MDQDSKKLIEVEEGNVSAGEHRPTDVSAYVESPEGSVEEAAAILASLKMDPKTFAQVEGMLDQLKDSRRTPEEDLVKMRDSGSSTKEPIAENYTEEKLNSTDEIIAKLKKDLNDKTYLDKIKEKGEILHEYMYNWMSVEALAYYFGKSLDYANQCLDAWLMGESVQSEIKYVSPKKSEIKVLFSVKDPLSTNKRKVEIQELIKRFEDDSCKTALESTLAFIQDIVLDIDFVLKKRSDGREEKFSTTEEVVSALAGLPEPFLQKLKADIIQMKIFYLVLAKHPGAYVSFS